MVDEWDGANPKQELQSVLVPEHGEMKGPPNSKTEVLIDADRAVIV